LKIQINSKKPGFGRKNQLKSAIIKTISPKFVSKNSKQIAKIGFGKKNQLSFQCVHIAEFRNFQF